MVEHLYFNKSLRKDVIESLVQRDGYRCMYPGCIKPFTKDDPPTIDHWIPRSLSGDDSISNLVLMHFVCNNKKGNTVPSADGKIAITARNKSPKEPRPEICPECMSGRLLLPGEECCVCGSGPMPLIYPQATKKKSKNCAHAGMDWCRWCVIGLIPRLV